MLYDRNPLLSVVADKLAVRCFVTQRVSSEILSKIYHVYDNETEIQLTDLPDKFVLKANHGSGFNLFVESAEDRNIDVIRRETRRWLATDYSVKNGEWGYKSIQPKLYAEEFHDPGNKEFIDFSFHCFDGEVGFIKILVGYKKRFRFSRYFDVNWRDLEVAGRLERLPQDYFPRPEYLKEMIEISENLSAGFDFLRVDLYRIRNKTVFGELTNYPHAGTFKYRPRSFDYNFGAYWKIESMTYLPKSPVQAIHALFRSER